MIYVAAGLEKLSLNPNTTDVSFECLHFPETLKPSSVFRALCHSEHQWCPHNLRSYVALVAAKLRCSQRARYCSTTDSCHLPMRFATAFPGSQKRLQSLNDPRIPYTSSPCCSSELLLLSTPVAELLPRSSGSQACTSKGRSAKPLQPRHGKCPLRPLR